MKENSYKPTKKLTLFGQLEKRLHINSTFLNTPYYLSRLFYLFFLGLLYIWNAHYHEKMLHKLNQLQPMVDSLRVKHMRLQSSYMFDSKQSEVAKKAAQLGIYESKVPPYIIAFSRNATSAGNLHVDPVLKSSRTSSTLRFCAPCLLQIPEHK
ncbi:FtsL-like putative cell division protein [Cardinium endosymbiont of Philonthus spinipes]|uniref:FtsL-like putative cell division protein n=1 Tax=Cardinium endosymbiont of Philonthus spinipes TaxID=3077941 RepID=UPI00313CBBBA